MKALIVLHTPDVSGPTLSLLRVAEELAARGFAIDVLAPNGAADAGRRFAHLASVRNAAYGPIVAPGSRIRYPSALAGAAAQTLALRAELLRSRPSVVIIATSALPTAVLASRLARCRTAVYLGEVPGGALAPQGASGWKGRLRRRLTLGLGEFFVCCSPFVAEAFRVWSRPHVIVEPRVTQPSTSRTRADARQMFGIPPDAVALTVIGSISPGRGQHVALAAAQLLEERGRRTFLLIVGRPHRNARDSAYAAALERAIGLHHISARVLAPRDDLGDVYEASDVVLNPVRIPEGFGRVCFEAALAQRPLIASRIGAIPEYFEDGEDAILVEPGDAAEIAMAVERLLDDQAMSQAMVARACAKARARMNRTDDAGLVAEIFRTTVDAHLRFSDAVGAGRGHGPTADRTARVVASNLRYEAATAALASKLERAGIHYVVMKGPRVSRWLHGGDFVRQSVDIDLLIRREDQAALLSLLSANGFVPMVMTTPGVVAHDIPVRRSDGTIVDIHTSIWGATEPSDTVWNALSGHTSVWQGATWLAADQVFACLLIATQCTQPGKDRWWATHDLNRALDLTSLQTWIAVLDLARSVGAAEALGAGLRTTRRGLSTADTIGAPAGLLHLAGLDSPPTTVGFVEFSAHRSQAARLKFLGRKLVPPADFMLDWHPVGRGGRTGLVLAYLYRPLWLAWWAPRGYLAWRRAKRVAAASRLDDRD